MNDEVDEAINAPLRVNMRGAQFALMADPRRPARVEVPADITDLEILNLIANVIMMGDEIRARRPSSRIVLPS